MEIHVRLSYFKYITSSNLMWYHLISYNFNVKKMWKRISIISTRFAIKFQKIREISIWYWTKKVLNSRKILRFIVEKRKKISSNSWNWLYKFTEKSWSCRTKKLDGKHWFHGDFECGNCRNFPPLEFFSSNWLTV